MKKFIMLSVFCFSFGLVHAQPWTGSTTSGVTTRSGDVVIGNTALEGSYGGGRVLQIKGTAPWISMLPSDGLSSFNFVHTAGLGSTMYSRAAFISFWTSPTTSGGLAERMRITTNGNVGIGTTLANNPNNYKLAVNGKIGAKEVQVENTSSSWADYVFEKDYKLMPLHEVESFIKENKHLPEVPNKAEVEQHGHKLGEMDVVLLKKVEELTLYVIELKKEINSLNQMIDQGKKD